MHTPWHFKRGHGSHPHPPPSWNGGTTVHSGGCWAGANLSPTPDLRMEHIPAQRLQALGNRPGASVWQLVGEEEPSRSRAVLKQTRPPPTALNGGPGFVSHHRFDVLHPLSLLPRTCGRRICQLNTVMGREGSVWGVCWRILSQVRASRSCISAQDEWDHAAATGRIRAGAAHAAGVSGLAFWGLIALDEGVRALLSCPVAVVYLLSVPSRRPLESTLNMAVRRIVCKRQSDAVVALLKPPLWLLNSFGRKRRSPSGDHRALRDLCPHGLISPRHSLASATPPPARSALKPRSGGRQLVPLTVTLLMAPFLQLTT